MKLDSAGRITFTKSQLERWGVEPGTIVEFRYEEDELYIIQVTEENANEYNQLGVALRIDSKNRLCFKYVARKLDLSKEEIKKAELLFKNGQPVIRLFRKYSKEECIRRLVAILAEEGKISGEEGEITITLQATIELR